MIAVITGDIVSSSKMPDKTMWLGRLKDILSGMHKILSVSDIRWDIFRGDSLQLKLTAPCKALEAVLIIRSGLKSLNDFYSRNMDIRMSIGIGHEGYEGKTISESDGEAFTYSGRQLDKIKKNTLKLVIKTVWKDFDEEMNVQLRLLDAIIGEWTRGSAEIVWMYLGGLKTQQKLADRLGISQPAVHKRMMRAHLEEIIILEQRFRKLVKELDSHE
jgi:hypothetical protein